MIGMNKIIDKKLLNIKIILLYMLIQKQVK